MNKTSVIVRIIVSLIFFISGLLVYNKLTNLFIVDRPGVKYIPTNIKYISANVVSFYFGLCLAFIPMSSVLLQLSKIKSILISGFTITVFLVAGVLAKRLSLTFGIDADLRKYKDGLEMFVSEASPSVCMVIALIIGFVILLYLKAKRILFRNDLPAPGKDLISLFFK